MSSAKYPGYTLISLMMIIAVVGSLFILEAVKSSAVVRLTESLDASNQAYFFDKSLATITQEAFSSHTEWHAYPYHIPLEERLESFLGILRNNLGGNNGVQTITLASAPGFVETCPQPFDGKKTFTYTEDINTTDCGFKLGEFLEKGPFAESGKAQVTFETHYQDKRASRKTNIETTSFLIPLTNLEIIAYSIGNNPLDSKSQSQLKKLSYSTPTSFFSLNQATSGGDIIQKDHLPYYYRYLVTACRHTFETVWSTQYRNTLLNLAYNQGYFSRESWPVKQFDGMTYDADNDRLSIDLAIWQGAFLAIVDETGGLKVSIKGQQSSSTPINLWVGSYAAHAPTVIELQLAESQPILGYFANCAVHTSKYCGALFADPKTTLHAGDLEIQGSLFFDANHPPFANCQSVFIHSSPRLKNLLKEYSPKLILSRSKVVL